MQPRSWPHEFAPWRPDEALAGWSPGRRLPQREPFRPRGQRHWINPAGGSWTNAANWNVGGIADGAGNAANFNALNLAADVIVTLDAPRTIGILNFDDQNFPKHRWVLQSGSGGALTLAGASPTIAILGAPTTIDAPVSGPGGFTKVGPRPWS